MMTTRNPIHLSLALTVFSIGIVACQGTPANNSAYVPMSQPGTSAFIEAGAAKTKVGPVVSSCGEKINITLAGLVNCKFREAGYAGQFHVTSNMSGIAVVTPHTGTAKTNFTVTGALAGKGNFVVEGAAGKRLNVGVKVGT
jgi:hypothetical protein